MTATLVVRLPAGKKNSCLHVTIADAAAVPRPFCMPDLDEIHKWVTTNAVRVSQSVAKGVQPIEGVLIQEARQVKQRVNFKVSPFAKTLGKPWKDIPAKPLQACLDNRNTLAQLGLQDGHCKEIAKVLAAVAAQGA